MFEHLLPSLCNILGRGWGCVALFDELCYWGRDLRLKKTYDIPSILSDYFLSLKMWSLYFPSDKALLCYYKLYPYGIISRINSFLCKLPSSSCFIIKKQGNKQYLPS